MPWKLLPDIVDEDDETEISPCRFLVDLDMPARASEILRSDGYHVTLARDLGLRADTAIAAYAFKKELTVLTQDRDYIAIPTLQAPLTFVFPSFGSQESLLEDTVLFFIDYLAYCLGERHQAVIEIGKAEKYVVGNWEYERREVCQHQHHKKRRLLFDSATDSIHEWVDA